MRRRVSNTCGSPEYDRLGTGGIVEMYRARDKRLYIAPRFIKVSPCESPYRTSPFGPIHLSGNRVYQDLWSLIPEINPYGKLTPINRVIQHKFAGDGCISGHE